jgi:hypothetical protein
MQILWFFFYNYQRDVFFFGNIISNKFENFW